MWSISSQEIGGGMVSLAASGVASFHEVPRETGESAALALRGYCRTHYLKRGDVRFTSRASTSLSGVEFVFTMCAHRPEVGLRGLLSMEP